MSASIMKLPLVALLLVLTTACAEQRMKKAEARLEALRKERAERTAREVEPLRKQLPLWKARIDASERSRAESQRELDTLREQLVKSWEGQDEKLESLASTSGLPAELYPALKSAQEALGEKLRPKQAPPEPSDNESEEAQSPDAQAQRFTTALQANNMSAVAEALVEWNPKPVAPPTAEETPEGAPAACEKPNEGQARCEVFPSKGDEGSAFVLCQVETVKQWWAASVDGQSLWLSQLTPAPHGRHKWVRALSSQVFLLEDESPEPVRASSAHGASVSSRRWLHVYGLNASTEADRLSLAMEGVRGTGQGAAQLLYVDLDADGAEEALWLAGEELRAISPKVERGGVRLLTQAQTCELLAGRTEAALQPALSACAAWSKRPGPSDGGTPPR